jgi:hypothetical protein
MRHIVHTASSTDRSPSFALDQSGAFALDKNGSFARDKKEGAQMGPFFRSAGFNPRDSGRATCGACETHRSSTV